MKDIDATQTILSRPVAAVIGVFALAATTAGLIAAERLEIAVASATEPDPECLASYRWQPRVAKEKRRTSTEKCFVITSDFGDGHTANGKRRVGHDGKYRPHRGTDFGGKIGDRVIAMAPGVVRYVGWNDWEGNAITIEHGQDKEGNYIRTNCIHLDARAVAKGQHVNYGDLIGTLGQTGKGSGRLQGEPAHVHCGILKSTTRYFDRGTYKYLNLRKYFFGPDLLCYSSQKIYPALIETAFKVVVPVICK